LTLRPTTEDGNVLIIVNAHPAILIDIPDETTCTIIKLKLSHSGEGERLHHSFHDCYFLRE
jgi:hypothetical protein